jgi:hypothetical protein
MMIAELVHYSGGDCVYVPSVWKQPKEGQLVGTTAERLIEAAGRCCYSSLGSEASRPSDLFHRNLAGLDGTTPHYSVHEHYHFTIETMLHPGIWLGIPDINVKQVHNGYRVTMNLRHCLEWPNNVVFSTDDDYGLKGLIARWGRVLRRVAFMAAPQIVSPSAPEAVIEHLDPFRIVPAQTDNEAFVTLFLEDSLVWSHEQVRHRFNISQRSGRFVDQTDREYCIHPLLKDYLQRYLEGAVPDDCGGPDYVVLLKDEINWHQRRSRELYTKIVDCLQNYQHRVGKTDKLTARKQARSAGRYYLGNGLSTEMLFTASIRSWRSIFRQRCSPFADQAIRGLMEKAQELIKSTPFGAML